MLYASYTFWEIQTWNQSLVATDVQNVAPRQTNISAWFTSTLMNILCTHKQPVTVCPAAVMTLAAVRKLHLWLTQLKQHTNSSEPRWSGSYFKRKPLATACVNLASQSTLPINNLSAYATLYAIFHSVCKPWKYAHSTRRKKHNTTAIKSTACWLTRGIAAVVTEAGGAGGGRLPLPSAVLRVKAQLCLRERC